MEVNGVQWKQRDAISPLDLQPKWLKSLHLILVTHTGSNWNNMINMFLTCVQRHDVCCHFLKLKT